MDTCTYEVRLANWKSIIAQCQDRPKGMTCKQWLHENGISDKKYYYWLRKIRRNAYQELQQERDLPAVTQQVSFAEIAFPIKKDAPGFSTLHETGTSRPDAIIHTHTLDIGVYNTASEALIHAIMREINHAC